MAHSTCDSKEPPCRWELRRELMRDELAPHPGTAHRVPRALAAPPLSDAPHDVGAETLSKRANGERWRGWWLRVEVQSGRVTGRAGRGDPRAVSRAGCQEGAREAPEGEDTGPADALRHGWGREAAIAAGSQVSYFMIATDNSLQGPGLSLQDKMAPSRKGARTGSPTS